MSPEDAKAILGIYRPGTSDAGDPFFAEALKLAGEDPEIGKWLAREHALDAAISHKLGAVPVPPGLKAALMSTIEPRNTFEWTWPSALGLAAAAAAITLLLALGFLRPGAKGDAGNSVENFRAEMVNFVSIDPPLEMKSDDLRKIKDHLADSSLTSVDVPEAMQKLPALGCRALLFRGYKVGLICFNLGGDRLAHLMVVDAAAFSGEPLPQGRDFHKEGDWMTATWAQGGKVYLLATQGGQKNLETLLAAARRPLAPGLAALLEMACLALAGTVR